LNRDPASARNLNSRLQLLAAGLALAIAMAVLVSIEYVKERDALLSSLEAQARIVGEGSAAALLFDDPANAAVNLASLRSIAVIRAAALYRHAQPGSAATLFAQYLAPGTARSLPDSMSTYDALPALSVAVPIAMDGREIGLMHVVADPDVLVARLSRYLLTVLLVAAGALVLAYLLTGPMRRRIALTESMLHTHANYDDLTQLPNRRMFNECMNRAVSEAAASRRSVSLLFCDLDNFKVINDSLGHAAGDALLELVAQRLRGAVRQSDAICRIGGDEFVAILEDCGDRGAAKVAAHIIDTLTTPFTLGDRSLSIGTSIGIAIYPRDGSDTGHLLRAADTALFAAKSAGRNMARFFSETLDVQAHERMALEGGLRRALRLHEFQVHYQVQVEAVSGEVIGAEALLRWHSPEFGDISPDRFISLAEECGLIGEIGSWVLNEACAQAAKWTHHIPGFVMAVNLSGKQLEDPALPSQVDACLKRYGITAQQLELEITESTLLTHSEVMQENLRALDAMNLGLSLDDFGTGYSSLAYLKRLPIARLKIDRGFVQDLPHDNEDAAIVSAIVALASSLGMDVVAEGVETGEQLAFVRDAGCRFVQGWLFGRAVPPAQFEMDHLPRLAQPGDTPEHPHGRVAATPHSALATYGATTGLSSLNYMAPKSH
jgi:diguanylate cyclase (GGDEF)-like protein